MSSTTSDPIDLEKTVKPSDVTSVKAGEIVENNNIEYGRYLALHAEFQAANGQSHRKFLRKRGWNISSTIREGAILTLGNTVDWRLLPTLSFLYLMCSLDKANAGNAKVSRDFHLWQDPPVYLTRSQLFGFLDDVGMTSTQFNLALMYFFFTYGLCEPLSNIALRRLGPKLWFPFIVSAWGLITTLTSQVSSYGGYIAIRLCLGITEAGLYPGSYFILSMWYTPAELATRMAIFYGANTAAGAFGGVIAYGVGNLDGALGWSAWRWLFVSENEDEDPTSADCIAAHRRRHYHRSRPILLAFSASIPTSVRQEREQVVEQR